MIETYFTFEEGSRGEGSPCCGYKMPPAPEPTPKVPKLCPMPACGSCSCSSCHRGAIRNMNPECPMNAVIPSITVDDLSGIKNIADCFVHVSSINTTFYIDDKHRMMITWAGPVEADDYDVAENPSKLRSQMMFDYKNNRIVYFDKQGRPNYIADAEYYKSIIGPTIERMVAEGEINLNVYGEYDEANTNLTLKVGAN